VIGMLRECCNTAALTLWLPFSNNNANRLQDNTLAVSLSHRTDRALQLGSVVLIGLSRG